MKQEHKLIGSRSMSWSLKKAAKDDRFIRIESGEERVGMSAAALDMAEIFDKRKVKA
jgi:hypothetical protein